MFNMGDKIKSAKNGKTYTVQWSGKEWVKTAESTKQLEIAVHKFTKV